MTVKEAQKIIESYTTTLSKTGGEGTVLRKVSALACSRASIKFAYYTLIENEIKEKGKIDLGVRDELTKDYSKLSSFVDDVTFEKYEGIRKDWDVKKSSAQRNVKDERAIKQYLAFTHSLRGSEMTDELNEYIKELENDCSLKS